MEGARMRIKIAMAHHKEPKAGDPSLRDPRYIHIGTGEARNCEGIYHDDDGDDNLADKNWTFCELTHLYWLWKNQSKVMDKDTEYVGLCHYRRRFDLDALEKLIDDANPDIICSTPAPIGIYNIRTQYAAAHNKADFDQLMGYIKECFYNHGHNDITEAWTNLRFLPAPYNCVVMKRGIFNDWCDRLFAILTDYYDKVKDDLATRDNYQRRAMGFLGERFTSWYITQMAYGQKMKVVEMPMNKMEGAI